MPDFQGLQIGLSALLAHRRALDVTGQNISNAGTEGYSRQRVSLVADPGPVLPAIHARWNGTGLGVRTGNVDRLNDAFLDARAYTEHANDNRLRQVATALGRVESAFGEPSDTGLGAQLADFWAGWDDVANRPEDVAARAQLIERGNTLAASFRRTDADLSRLRTDTIAQMKSIVAEVNTTAARVGELNESIQAAKLAGLSTNDLMDQRDLLIGEIADRVGVTLRDSDNGMIDVFVGGTAIVRGHFSEELEVQVDTSPAQTVSLAWVKDGLPAPADGRIGGMIQSVNDVIPRYRTELDTIAQQVATQTNTIHATGFDLDGVAGQPFFQFGLNGLEVNPAVASDPRKVAAAATAGTFDGSIARQLAAVTGPDTDYRELIVRLGVEAQSANRQVEIQEAITNEIDASREAQSGVNLDEEMTNLIAYQHAYEAAARFVSAVDETIGTLLAMAG